MKRTTKRKVARKPAKRKAVKKAHIIETFLLNEEMARLSPKENEPEKISANKLASMRLKDIEDGTWESLVKTAVIKWPK